MENDCRHKIKQNFYQKVNMTQKEAIKILEACKIATEQTFQKKLYDSRSHGCRNAQST